MIIWSVGHPCITIKNEFDKWMKRGKDPKINKTSLTVANTMKIAKLCCNRNKMQTKMLGEKQRDKKETILRILWPKQAGKTHTHIHLYIHSYHCVCVRANQVQKETIIIIIINWPVAHLISFVYSLHYCALHNLSCQSRFEGERGEESEREQTWKLSIALF